MHIGFTERQSLTLEAIKGKGMQIKLAFGSPRPGQYHRDLSAGGAVHELAFYAAAMPCEQDQCLMALDDSSS
jgi:hypothetical protein